MGEDLVLLLDGTADARRTIIDIELDPIAIDLPAGGIESLVDRWIDQTLTIVDREGETRLSLPAGLAVVGRVEMWNDHEGRVAWGLTLCACNFRPSGLERLEAELPTTLVASHMTLRYPDRGPLAS